MNLDYIAGFFDGEGYATLRVVINTELNGHRAYVTPRIGFAQSKERSEVLCRIQHFLGVGTIRISGAMAHLTVDRRADVEHFIELMQGRTVIRKVPLGILKEAVDILDLANGRISGEQLNRLFRLRTELLNHMPSRARKRAEKGHQTTLRRYVSSGLAKYYLERDGIPTILRRYRREKGITQEALSKLFGISRGTLQHYERSDRVPRFANAMKILNLMAESQ